MPISVADEGCLGPGPPTRPLGGSLKETRGVSHETELSSSSRCPASANWGESLDHPPVARYCDRCGKALLGAGGPWSSWVCNSGAERRQSPPALARGPLPRRLAPGEGCPFGRGR